MRILVSTFLMVLASCSERADKTPRAQGRLQVEVLVDPPAARLPIIRVDKNEEHCGKELQNPLLAVGDREVRDAVLWIDSPAIERDGPAQQVPLHSKGCLFDPRISVGRAGDLVVVGSADDITHNPHGWLDDETTVFNLTVLNSSVSFRRRLERAGRYRIDCDTHKWMRAYLFLFDHPFFAKTDEAGKAAFEVPLGRHALHVWHETLGEQVLEIDVRADQALEVQARFTLADRRERSRISPNEAPWTPN